MIKLPDPPPAYWSAAFGTLLASLLTIGSVAAQQGDGTDLPIRTHVFKPIKVDATHVLAKGEIVGRYRQATTPPK